MSDLVGTHIIGFLTHRLKLLLTVFLVEQYLHLFLSQFLKRFFQFLNGGSVGEISVHEATGAALLHRLGAVISRQFTEAVITVYYGVVDYPGVGKEETVIWKYKRDVEVRNND